MKNLHAATVLAILAAVLAPAPAGARDEPVPPKPTATADPAAVHEWESRAVADRIRKGQAACHNPAAEAQRICASTRELEKETR